MTAVLEPTLDPFEYAARQFEPRPPSKWATPGALAVELDPMTRQTPALELIDRALVDVVEGRCDRLAIAIAPQEGKSQRTSRRFPEWALSHNPDLRIAIVSYAHSIARRWGRAIRDDINTHGKALGLAVNPNSSAAHEWEIDGRVGGVYCVGIKGSLTSRPVDLLIIDDPYKDAEQADSEAWQETVEDFWTEVAVPRLAPGAPVVIIQTRWRQNDLTGWLTSNDDEHAWRVINIPAQADHNPDKGQTDPLDREPGEYLLSARGRTVADWEQKKREVGSRSWLALYQGRPAPAEGGLFKRGWWRYYQTPRWVVRDDGSRWVHQAGEIVQSWDMAFKDTRGSDFVVGQVWEQRGADVYLLDQIHARLDFTATCAAVEQLSARWPQATAKLVEDKASGPAVIAQLQRKVPGLIAITPKDSKYARAAAVSPFVEAGNVWLPAPDLAPWVGDYVEEHAAFPTGTHDDQVDGMSQALARLMLAGTPFDQAQEWLRNYRSA